MTVAEVRTSPKKIRRPRAETLRLWDAIALTAHEYDRMTIRQLFYQLVARGEVEKTEAAYKRVADAAAQMRLQGALPYRKIADGTRERRQADLYGGVREALVETQNLYRRNLWRDQAVHVEVWCEKDALSGVLWPVCYAYGVTYVAARGFSSLTLQHESAQAMIATGKPARVFYCGDWDASGDSMYQGLQRQLQFHGADVEVRRLALDRDMVIAYRLPTRPGKETDSRHRKFAAEHGGASVELDALPPSVLVKLVEEAIIGEIDAESWNRLAAVEESERLSLAELIDSGWYDYTSRN